MKKVLMMLIVIAMVFTIISKGMADVNMIVNQDYVAYGTSLTKVIFEISGEAKVEDNKLSFTNLIEELSSIKTESRIQATHLLGKTKEQPKNVTEALIHALKDKDFMVRTNAAWALGEICSTPKATIPALVQALNDKKEHVRINAAAALFCFGSEAKVAIVSLRKILKDENEVVRHNAQIVLNEIDKERERIMEVQLHLAELGYNLGKSDGILGTRTIAAIRAYQKDRGLPMNGKITEELLKSLRKDN